MLPPIKPLRRHPVPAAAEARRRISLRAARPKPVRRWLARTLRPFYVTWGRPLGFLLGLWMALELLLPLSGS